LLGIRAADELDENRLKGNLFENMMVAEFQKKNQHQYQHRDYYFWQDNHGYEVDLLMKKPSGFDIFEIKATQTISTELFKKMDSFEEMAAPTRVNKTLIYGGGEDQKRTKHTVLSWKNF
jgi:predicted AAA+ superfamily ATPase